MWFVCDHNVEPLGMTSGKLEGDNCAPAVGEDVCRADGDRAQEGNTSSAKISTIRGSSNGSSSVLWESPRGS